MFRFWLFLGHGSAVVTKAFTLDEFKHSLSSIPLGQTPNGEPEFIIYES